MNFNVKNSIRYDFKMYITVILCSAFFSTAFSCSEAPAEKVPGLYAFENVTVLPMNEDTEQVLESQTVIVRDGRIEAVSPAEEAEVPDGAEVIDGTGRYLMPGLAEMHGHIPGPDNPQYAEDVLFLYVSNGITTVRNMAGHPFHLELREQVNSGEVTGPAIFAASPWLSTNIIPEPEAADSVVRAYHEAGFDLMKIGSLSPDIYEAMAASANEIGFPFGGHIPEEVGLVPALEARQASIDHYDRYVEFLAAEHPETTNRNSGFFGSGVIDLADEERIPEAIELTLEAGTWNVPTLSLVEHLASPEDPEEMIQRPEMRYMPQDVLDGWVNAKHDFRERDDFQPDATQRLVEIRQKLTRDLYDSGAPIALGSDAPQFFNVPGFSIHHEMEMMVAAGLTPYEVLLTGTRNPAVYFDMDDEFGTVEENRRADLILLEANPLEDISNVQERAGVMLRGEWWPETGIQERLDEIAGRTE